ncbi:YihY/virulence factor BrkB family protein [Fodinibius sp. Rm-B-1B1-1]|uniref:YihY/virulence factor BrkB family protein n=1 Tax=Fodinibius alkaliphilus TaxID=3140241 RepID=UPI00315A1459
MKLLTNIKELLTETYQQIWEVNIGLHGAAIAFYAIFSTAPLAIITVWIVSMVLGSQLGEAGFEQTIETIAGPELTASIDEIVVSTAQGASGFWSSLIAIATLLFGATTLLSQIKYTLNLIWGLEETGLNSFWQFLWDRLVSLLFIGALSLLFLAGLISESIIYSLQDLLIPIVGDSNLFFLKWGTSIVNVVLAITFFAVLFRILPDLNVRWRDILVGAAVTTILVIAGKSLVDWYLGSLALQPMYKAAGSFVVFLVWIYYNIQVVLVGAIFTRVYTQKFGDDIEHYWQHSS